MSDSHGRTDLEDCLQVLVGLPLSIARKAAGMTIFHFGAVRPHPSGKGTVGAYALHIQCPWRLIANDAVLTGTADSFVGPSEGLEIDDADVRSGNLQAVRIGSLLQGYDEVTRSFVNTTGQLVVTDAHADAFGGADLALSGGYRLQIFPDGSRGEDWRFMELQGRHVVIEGGRTRVDD